MRRLFARLAAILLLLGGVLAASALDAQQTATLAGTVVTADSSRAPVRRAVVTIAATGQQSRGTVTDENGRFRFAGVAPGRFTLTVSKPAYLPATYGATPRRPNGAALELAPGAAITDLVVPIARGAIISGVVRHDSGEPASGVGIVVLGRSPTGFTRALELSRMSAITDDRGAYRVYGLPEGDFAVAVIPSGFSSTEVTVMTNALVDAAIREQQRRSGRATPGAGGSVALSDPPRPRSYVPLFYPGTPSAGQAAWLTLSAGEERAGVDIVLSLVPVASIEGVMLGVDGTPISGLDPSLTSDGPQIPLSLDFGSGPDLSLRPGADGKFRFTGVAPGHYTLAVRTATGPPEFVTGGRGGAPARGRPTPAATPAWASTEIDVTGDDITNIVLKLQPAMTLTGKLVFAEPPPAIEVMTQMRLSMTPLPAASQPTVLNGVPQGISPTSAGAMVRADGTFELRGLIPGLYRLWFSVAPAAGPTDYWARSATLEGRDFLDAPVEIRPLGDISDVVLLLSRRHTELSGTLQDASGRPDTDDAVIVFPADRALWQPQSRRIRSMRPNTSGRFSFPDLPPGDYILATLTDASGTDWQKPESLAQIVSVGVKVTIGEGERKTQDLRAR